MRIKKQERRVASLVTDDSPLCTKYEKSAVGLKLPQQGRNSLFYRRIGIHHARRNHFPERFSRKRKEVAEDGSPHFVTIVQILILLIDKINIITDILFNACRSPELTTSLSVTVHIFPLVIFSSTNA